VTAAGAAVLLLYFLGQAAALVMIPLGLPGIWIQVGAAVLLVLASKGALLGWGWVGVFFGLALVGEVVEFLSGQWGTRRFGGSRRAGWGALIGGLVGAVVGGIPIPVIGSIVMSFVGTFVGAVIGEMSAQRGGPDVRVGLGAVVGRAVGVATKLALGIVILIVSVTVMLLRAAAGPVAAT
jgi:uncharacterized protein YqgC (DUF456 family)